MVFIFIQIQYLSPYTIPRSIYVFFFVVSVD